MCRSRSSMTTLWRFAPAIHQTKEVPGNCQRSSDRYRRYRTPSHERPDITLRVLNTTADTAGFMPGRNVDDIYPNFVTITGTSFVLIIARANRTRVVMLLRLRHIAPSDVRLDRYQFAETPLFSRGVRLLPRAAGMTAARPARREASRADQS